MEGIFYPWNLTGSVLNIIGVVKLLAAAGSFFVVGIILIIRQPLSQNQVRCTMIPRKVHNLCQEPTVTSELARDPSQYPQKIFHRLFECHHKSQTHDRVEEPDVDRSSKWDALNELQKARACGDFGSTETSDLFLKVSEVFINVDY